MERLVLDSGCGDIQKPDSVTHCGTMGGPSPSLSLNVLRWDLNNSHLMGPLKY